MKEILTAAITELDGYRANAARNIDPNDSTFVITNGHTLDERNLRVYGDLYRDEIDPRTGITEGFRVQRLAGLEGPFQFPEDTVVAEAKRLGGDPVRYRAWLQVEVNVLQEDIERLSKLRDRFNVA